MPCKNVTPHAPNVRLRTKGAVARSLVSCTDGALSPCFTQSTRVFVLIGIVIALVPRPADLLNDKLIDKQS